MVSFLFTVCFCFGVYCGRNSIKLAKLYKSPRTLYFYFLFFYFIIFNDTPVSSTHTLPVNIFNLEGGETMFARENENFRVPGENRTRDPRNTRSYVLTTEPPVWIFVHYYAFLRRCCLRVWMAWGALRMQENCILRALIFKFSWGNTTPLVKLVQITHVKSWIHPCCQLS